MLPCVWHGNAILFKARINIFNDSTVGNPGCNGRHHYCSSFGDLFQPGAPSPGPSQEKVNPIYIKSAEAPRCLRHACHSVGIVCSIDHLRNMMPYDPFYVPTSQDGDSEAGARKMISVRRPPVCDIPLSKLEWSGGEGFSHRKRSRPEHHSHTNATRSQEATENRPNHTQPSTDVNAVGNSKEVIRIVEKIVHAEPTTIMGVPPLVDDRVRYVVNFILEHVKSSNVEIEAKLGSLIEKSHGVRAIELVPVLCETPIRYESNKDTRFQSDVGGEVFTRLNSRLNERVELTAKQEQGRIHYLRTREMDVYWPGRVRETKVRRNASDGSEHYETIRVQSKTRLGDLNVLCPNKIADIRYSASMEEDCSIPSNSAPQMHRIKDRISYKYEYLSIDITCVEMQDKGSNEPSTTFEVEVEIDANSDLYGEVLKYRNGDETSKLFDIAGSFVNTVRLLLEE